MATRDEIVEHERSHPKAVEAIRKLTDAQRFRAMSDLIDSVRAMMAAGVRQQHPDWSQEQITAEVARRVSRANG